MLINVIVNIENRINDIIKNTFNTIDKNNPKDNEAMKQLLKIIVKF